MRIYWPGSRTPRPLPKASPPGISKCGCMASSTKGDVLRFYERIATRLLPHLRDRPITLERFPEGLTGEPTLHFWQKNTPAYYPAWIPRVTLPSERGQPVTYALVNDTTTLLYL